MEEDGGGSRRPLVVLTAPPLHGHMTPLLQLATALHAKGFTIAIAHSQLNPPDPSNHPKDFVFLPLSDDLSAVDASPTFTDFIQTLNTNCRPSFHQHLTRLITERNIQDKSIVIIYDHIMFFAGDVAIDLNLTSILFRSSSATFFTAFLARQQLNQQAQFLEDFVMQDMVPGLHPLRYKDLPFSKYPIEVWHQVLAIFRQESNPSAVILNTVKFLEHDAISQIHQHYQVPIFAVGPLHKITPSPPTSFVEEDTSCITWLDKQAPKSVIYVSFGSLMTLDAKLLAEMAWGLAKSNQPFLWAVRPGSVGDLEWVEFLSEGFKEETSGRSLIVKWAPQKEVLAHSAVGGFWSHCGWNSTLESISEGVPLICQPFNVDQGVHARYVSYVWKIGLELEVLERGEMESMIRRIMVDEEGKEVRARAGEMKEMVKDAVQNGGSSHNSLEDLVGFIMSSS